jgi:F-type H+-transporting ATPase subunit epsilon
MALSLKIVTPSSLAFEETVDELQVPGWEGQYGVLPQHARMLTLTKPGVAVLYRSGGTQKVLLGKGFAEIGEDRVTLLVDSYEDVAGIDKAAAKEDLTAALAELSGLALDDPRIATAESRVELAYARAEA